MGYILPIVQYQYGHYHERTRRVHEQKSHVEKTFKVVLKEINQYQSFGNKYKYDQAVQPEKLLEQHAVYTIWNESKKGIILDEKV